jgi:regulator of protease activity HflC (stomatin/prohibitin superfamily)
VELYFVGGAVLLFLAIYFFSISARVVQEYERGVIFRIGRLVGARGPGLFLLIPGLEKMIKVDLRVFTLDVPSQEAITRDNVTIQVDAVVYFRVVNPSDAVVKVENYRHATELISQTTLRSVVGQSELDEILTQREQVNERLQQVIDEATEPWGVKVSNVETRDVRMPEAMQRAMARQAEAERERRAKIISAEGEFQAAQRLADAAEVIATQPSALTLRYLSALQEMSSEGTHTILFPLPVDIIGPFIQGLAGRQQPPAPPAPGRPV